MLKSSFIIAGIIITLFVGFVLFRFIKISSDVYSMIQNTSATKTAKESIDQIYTSLERQKIFTEEELEKIKTVLNKDVDTFQKYGINNPDTFKVCIISTMDSLQPIIVDDNVILNLKYFFYSANSEYGEPHDINIVYKVIDNWCKERITPDAKILMITNKIKGTQSSSTDEEDIRIYTFVKEQLLSDISAISNHLTMNEDEIANRIKKSLALFDASTIKTEDGEDYSLVYLIPDVYHRISEIAGCNNDSILTKWFNQMRYTPPTFEQITRNTHKYILAIKEAGIIDANGMSELQNIINKDIELFKTSTDTTFLRKTAINSLKKIERITGDTEDREFFANTYFGLAANRGIKLGKDLDIWMYGVDLTSEISKNKDKLPWE